MKRAFLFGLLCFGFYSFAHPQSSPLVRDQVIERVVYNRLPRERVHVHLDRSYYSPGDTVWLKAYVVSGTRNLLSNFSRIVYVDLIDPDGNLVQSARLPLFTGTGAGDFSLPPTLLNGAYRIRAYTNWMRNFDEAYFFETTVSILDPFSHNAPVRMEKTGTPNTGTLVPSTDGPIKIDLFPEGGNLSFGQLNRVAVKVTRPGNTMSTANGWLETNKGERITEVYMGDDGLGDFKFIAEPETDYFIMLEDGKGHVKKQKLPLDDQTGYGLAVNNLFEDNLIVEVRVDPGEINSQPLNLLIHHRGEILISLNLNAERTTHTFKLPKRELGDGVNEIVLLSEGMEPLAYRKVFHLQPSRSLPMQVETDETGYSMREKVKVSLVVGNDRDSSKMGSFSVSVTHQGKVPYTTKNVDNIISSLLFKSTAKGNTSLVESIGIGGDRERNTRLDNFLLTLPKEELQMEKQKGEILFPVEKDMRISGLVTKANGRAVVNSKVTLFSLDTRLFLDTITDERGRFAFDGLAFYDSTRFIVQARTDKDKRNLKIILDSVPPPMTTKNGDLPLDSIKGGDAYMLANKERMQTLIRAEHLRKSILLQDVQVEGKDRRLRYSNNLNGPGVADQIIYAEDLKNCVSLEQCLQGRLVGVRFIEGKAYSSRTSMSVNSGTPSMTVIIDGMPMVEPEGPLSSVSVLSSINPSEIETIEVVRGVGTAIYGPNGAGGVLIITTKRGGSDVSQVPYKSGVVPLYPKRLIMVPDFLFAGLFFRHLGISGKGLEVYHLLEPKSGKR